jgi:hypothetical protein
MAERGGNRGGAGPAKQRGGRRKERGRGEADRWGQSSASAGIKEKEEEGDGPLREGVDGPLGRRAEKVRR